MIFKWLKKRREKKNREIVQAVYNMIKADQNSEHFLSPVVLNGKIFITTKQGRVYSVDPDPLKNTNGLHQVCRII